MASSLISRLLNYMAKKIISFGRELPTYYCPRDCPVKCNIPELVIHLQVAHKADMHEGCYLEWHTQEITPKIAVINCYGRQFCLHFKPFLLNKTPSYIAFLQLLGEDIEAKNFCYELKIGINDKTYTWKGVPRSFCDSPRNTDGLLIPQHINSYVRDLKEQEPSLQVKGSISIEQTSYMPRDWNEQERAFAIRSSHGFVERPLLDCVRDNKVLENVAVSLELPYGCPYPGRECSITGNIRQLVAHLKDIHNVDVQYGSTFNHRYVISDLPETQKATWMLTVFICFGRHFCLYFEAFPTGVTPCYILYLLFMGENTEAKKYGYCIKLGRNGRELTWEGVPRSFCESPQKVSDNTDGLVIPRNLAHLFSCGNEQELKLRMPEFWYGNEELKLQELKLRVTGRIWKEY